MNIVITGTTSGLGKELKHAFNALNSKSHHAVDVMGSGEPGNHEGEVEMNLADSSSVHRYAQYALERFSKIDLLINNAGVNGICEFENLTHLFISEMMAVNCIGPVMLTQYLLPKLAHGGTVVNIVSDAAWRPMRHSLAYNCSKAAFDMATKQMARELTKPHGISVVGIRPGRMSDTNMSRYIDASVVARRGWTMDQVKDYFKQNSVTGEEACPSHVASLIVDLCLNPNIKRMSGACLDLVG